MALFRLTVNPLVPIQFSVEATSFSDGSFWYIRRISKTKDIQTLTSPAGTLTLILDGRWRTFEIGLFASGDEGTVVEVSQGGQTVLWQLPDGSANQTADATVTFRCN